MSTQVLARKWRPKVFSELTGQAHVVKALFNALSQNRLHHAYLFTGTRGVGKTTIARILAKALNCETGVTPDPCGKCASCLEIDGGRFVDLIELDAASNTGIDNMREVLDNAQYLPTSGRFKVYIIDEVHMLSTKAFNSMLKTLEEPPEHVKFILATTDPQKIPVTVLSRCLQFNLKQIPETLILEHAAKILEKEGIACEKAALRHIAKAAQGSMRDALSLLDQAIAYSGGKVDESLVRDMLGAIDQGYLYSILEALSARDGKKLLDTASEMEGRSLSFETALQDLSALLHRVSLAQIVPSAISEDFLDRDRVFSLAKTFHPDEIQLFYQIAIHGRNEISLAPDEYAGFSMTLLRMLAFLPEQEVGREESRPRPGREGSPAPRQESHPETKREERFEPKQEAAPQVFDGDWVALASKLNLSGMAKMLAHHSSLRNFTESVIELSVSESHKHLMERSYQERVTAAVSEWLGRKVDVAFSLGEGVTPAQVGNEKKEERQKEAVSSIESDPFVRTLIESHQASLIESSIKPL